MNAVPLLVALPLLVAFFLMASAQHIGQTARQCLALLVALAVGIGGLLLSHHCATHGAQVYWFGGWTPRPGWMPGICFQLDSLNCLFVALSGFLTANAVLFSWGYFKQVKAVYESLLLIFLAAMVGYVLTADLFNLFVWFELMSVCAYALTAYKVEEAAPVAGALNFAFCNSVGAYSMLMGLGLLYLRTSALNMALMAQQLTGPPDALVRVGFALMLFGLLTKAALAPFHMWLADAHAVAPSPVSSLFSGMMVGLGIFGVCRLETLVFHHQACGALGLAMLALGVFTALLGGCMSLMQRHLKRLLAFSTISHMGVALMGVSLLTSKGQAAGLHYLLSHGMVKASLFLAAGAILDRTGEIDEHVLQGRGRRHPLLGLLFLSGWAILMGCPPFGVFRSKDLLEHAGPTWFAPVLTLASALTGAAILRAGLRIFLGLGKPRGDASTCEPHAEVSEESRETTSPPGPLPLRMLAAVALPLIGAFWFGLDSRAAAWANSSVTLWCNRLGVWRLLTVAPQITPSEPVAGPEPISYAWAAATLLLAAGGAAAQLRGTTFPLPRRLISALRHLHSGRVGDYLLWMLLGFCFLCAAMLQP